MVLEGWMVATGLNMLGLVGHAMFISGKFGARLDGQEKQIDHLLDTVVYRDTCDSRHAPLDVMRNGKLKEG
jgi:hypothetical protein